MFDENVKFKYEWRPYQKRVLDNATKYLQDGKVHIVAAPGSGKTVLGIELLLRLNKPVLILAPTVTIKNQWVERFVSSFLNQKEFPDYISTDIYNLKKFNVVTYQALHYAYKKTSYKEDVQDLDTDDVITETKVEIDESKIKEYNLLDEILKNGIETLVLDEAHHLKNEWWKSILEVSNSIKNRKIISLTATPPYDVDYNEFNKYIELCGQIDETISVPELVLANNLCPHQDYIFLNKPTKEEMAIVDEYNNNLKNEVKEIMQDEEFISAIKNHKYIINPYLYEEELLENIEYYSSMIIFLNAKGISLSKENIEILGHDKKIPNISLEWIEILLKNVIISDRQNYVNYESCIKKIESALNKIGAIEKRNIALLDNKIIENCFINSIAKLDSISQIVKIENSNLKEKLRMVILTDYIRKEYLQLKDIEIKKLGVLPIFITLRKSNPDINMAILTGSMFVIPKEKEKNLYGLCISHEVNTESLSFEPLEIDENYSIVKISNNLRNKVMSLICKLFASGEITVMIGTKSLLGEGWDEPSINTLVMASFVGSYMLSNQMRGRAIRVNKDPRKTANIWHLVCINPYENNNDYDFENTDYNMLKRRFKSFCSVGYNTSYINSGISRLGVYPPFTEEKIVSLNKSMIDNAINRDKMYNLWKNAVETKSSKDAQMIEKVEIDETNTKMKKAWFIDNKFIFICVIFILVLLDLVFFHFLKFKFLFITLEIVLAIFLLVKTTKIHKLSNNEKNIKELGKVVLNSLYRCKFIKTGISRIKVVVKKPSMSKVECYLTGASESENNLFITSLQEVLSKTINQRYIITRLNKKLESINDYYNVPTVLATKKEFAEVFKVYFEAKIGKCDLVYTKNAEGRKMLIKARMKSLGIKDKFSRKEEYIYYK